MDEKLKEQFEQFVEQCGENYNNVDKVKKRFPNENPA